MNNLVLTGLFEIKIVNNKFSLYGTTVNINDVAYVRYRLDSFNNESVDEYIEKMIKKFNVSSHLIEVPLSLTAGADIDRITEKFDNVIPYLYLDIADEDVDRHSLSDDKIGLLNKFKESGAFVERVMLRDKSTSLYTISGNKIREQVASILEMSSFDIGFCQSPLSLCDGNCCLTAERARKLSAQYNECDSAALPSANHEFKNENNCGCIKHTIVKDDLLGMKEKETKVKNKDTEPKGKKAVVAKKRGIPSIINW